MNSNFLRWPRLSASPLSGVSLLLAVLAGAAPPEIRGAEPAGPVAGAIVPHLVCAHEPAQSYAVYVPSAYTHDRAWPILYCFDPGGRGPRPVEIFRAAAERLGYIVVGSNNSHNGPWSLVDDAARAMVIDTQRRFHLDLQRRYAAGFSGGARAACAVTDGYRFAGVIACGAGFPEPGVPKKVEYIYYGAAGIADFNYPEVHAVDATFAARQRPHRFTVFEGGHQWLPPAVADDALAWIELQAMRTGLRPKDTNFVAEQFQARLQSAAAQTEPGKAYLAYRDLAADFAGLTDTAEPLAKAAALKGTKPVKRYLSAEKSQLRQDELWRDRLSEALGQACNPPISRFSSPAELGGSVLGGGMDSSGGGSMGGGSYAGAITNDVASTHTPDRFAAIRDLADELQRQDQSNPSVRRARNRALAWIEHGRIQLESGHPDNASIFFEAAAIVNPAAPEPYYGWARACALLHDKVRAHELLRRAIANGFNDHDRIAQLERSLAP